MYRAKRELYLKFEVVVDTCSNSMAAVLLVFIASEVMRIGVFELL
jgi:hypothetical protein